MTKIEHSLTHESIGSLLIPNIVCDICFQHSYKAIDKIVFTYSSSAYVRTVNPDNGSLVAVFKCKKKDLIEII